LPSLQRKRHELRISRKDQTIELTVDHNRRAYSLAKKSSNFVLLARRIYYIARV